MNGSKLSKRRIPTESTDVVVVEDAAGNVALVEGRVGAARLHREVHDVGEPAQHLLVDCPQVHCGEVGCGGRGEHWTHYGENAYKVCPQRPQFWFNARSGHFLSSLPLSLSLHGISPLFVHVFGCNIGNSRN